MRDNRESGQGGEFLLNLVGTSRESFMELLATYRKIVVEFSRTISHKSQPYEVEHADQQMMKTEDVLWRFIEKYAENHVKLYQTRNEPREEQEQEKPEDPLRPDNQW